ncbi:MULTISPECIES: cob(I)yrinic acid a,c-diamide adenosyltransferase [Clostridium]|uniref:cob(I)yrinic acid a,c-diamide adenosyltransferase n=1 Tax=Clostridium TaxID=1485 RepID=UPI00069E71E4|nr:MULTISPECIES: cob(I)yrinic acid a,c-diamide adenosyltransferase [Clostridium]KOF55998.1 cob(I)yrinic acid a c-diamide adenosyltransferase [Clostridium sp. DMHC 10]MCD2345416.1 cob(I)yrinic acid a,c-diamide adenosyltransferase [Clostridium guangxiense]
MNNIEEGFIEIYTGDGKGKTTAALGLGMRAVGNGMTVYMVQFLKSSSTGELASIKKLEPYFKLFRFERERDFFWNLNDKQKEELKDEIRKAYEFCVKVLKNKQCDVLIMDEIMGVLQNNLLREEDILKLISLKPKNVELVLTGRNAPSKIIDKADLVTEMRPIKHYFEKGVAARKGIEY